MRNIQLNHYLNYLNQHEFLSKTKEFVKFTSETEFDEEFFSLDESPFNFPYSSAINTDNIKNKIYGMFSNIFGSKELNREITDEEISLKKMETHYKLLLEKYLEIRSNVVYYIKSLKENSTVFKNLSNACFYVKDSLEQVPRAHGSFKGYTDICIKVSEVNSKNYRLSGKEIESKFEVKCATFKNLEFHLTSSGAL